MLTSEFRVGRRRPPNACRAGSRRNRCRLGRRLPYLESRTVGSHRRGSRRPLHRSDRRTCERSRRRPVLEHQPAQSATRVAALPDVYASLTSKTTAVTAARWPACTGRSPCRTPPYAAPSSPSSAVSRAHAAALLISPQHAPCQSSCLRGAVDSGLLLVAGTASARCRDLGTRSFPSGRSGKNTFALNAWVTDAAVRFTLKAEW